ncbi:phage terminase large subunit [Elizabethkingia meningoseptica]|uniref:phage terminase large subunit n=1 Tax=Elizabethkingia meningoseptica TaxID=238 RepID=UPI0022F1B5D3|nr:phage terminase large subunit [Elizabethkingia meningoseptica]EJK5330539.1 phage terminase large subunit [Elizabethkingia meningoseptica]WBS75679.1 phage terminase large subunit [Elizabethkingia meningoseptica]
MSEALEIRDIDATKTWVLQSTLNFTRYFFKENYGKKFIVGDHHRKICDALDKVIKGEITRLIINIAPRYGKTEIAVKNFVAYGLALNPAAKFIHLSYSDDLARDNSREVQSTVKNEAYQELFEAQLTSESTKKWYTSAGGGLYAVSSGGQVTGFGAGAVDYADENESNDFEEFVPYYDSEFAGAIIIDDPIKPDDALSDQKRDAVNNKFDTTIRNRVNSRKTPIIIIMQRLHQNDLCGYLQKLEGIAGVDDGGEWTVLEFPCLYNDENGNKCALWAHKHTVEELEQMQQKNNFVFQTQYQQNPKPKEGLMYDRPFKTYTPGVVPYSLKMIRKNYTDVADTGDDYLCSIDYVETERGLFVVDILFTKKPQEYTEPKHAEMLAKDRIEKSYIESNNGGRSYGRNVEAQTRILKNFITEFDLFFQGGNKDVRIFTRSNEVMNMIYFPEGWENMWPEFYQHITTYMKTGKNKHDDGPDVLTGMVEKIGDEDGDSAEGYF